MRSITRSMVGRCVGILRWLDSLLGLRMSSTKFWCFFVCVGRGGYHQATERHDIVKDWPVREDFILRKHNVKDVLLLNLEKVLLHPQLWRTLRGLWTEVVKASSACAASFQISMMPEVNEGSLLAYILEKLCVTRISKGNLIPLKWLCEHPSDHWFMAFWTSEKGELPEVRIPDIT